MLNLYIHEYPNGYSIPYLTCSYCGGVIENVFAASATFPFDAEKVSEHLPAESVPLLDYTRIFLAHSTKVCDEMVYERANILWGTNFFQENLGEFILQILLNTSDTDTLIKKQELLLEDDVDEGIEAADQ